MIRDTLLIYICRVKFHRYQIQILVTVSWSRRVWVRSQGTVSWSLVTESNTGSLVSGCRYKIQVC